MCRFLIFKGTEDILLADLLTRPAHSIINQSYDSRLRIDMRRPINGDGFGVGYYTPTIDAEPCIYTSITPAWNNINLSRLASKTMTKLAFAHIRASTSGALAETNCHPFSFHTLMFMHNGAIANFHKIQKRLAMYISDPYFTHIQGSTDSEWAFALVLECLHRLGVDPADPQGNFPPKILKAALLDCIALISQWTTEVSEEPSLLNFALTDGSSIVASRYISSKTDEAASLHFSSGSKFLEYEPGKYRMERHDRRQDVILISSEPLTFERNDWVTIPTNTLLLIHDQNILMYPIIDQFYQDDPTFARSSEYAASLGLVGSVPIGGSVNHVPPLERERRLTVPSL
ncbi:hypothetical protein CANCADRAFT_4545 [Tortispora caseinolytica NRRL Y-17796]|uniref:Glutamine amidotransferase type-2 domain-containing protein n=1 Tax=Tortispora caseinolytica NRRL Y-17796 TaxID=767744 RepID=A0A1E4T9S9_9ASCO|nr:hypothetical protein CANCADRAFT_4545 [Tortispora caseinolytica NRRL Y-17796]